jgi:hypothetical protein
VTKSKEPSVITVDTRFRLVLDVCVAIAASHADGNGLADKREQSAHDTRSCLEVLETILADPSLKLAMSDGLVSEWIEKVFDDQIVDAKREHAAEWLTEMDTSLRVHHLGKICYAFLAGLPSRIRHDTPLIESALEADKRVISIDEDIREELVAYASVEKGNGIGDLIWANPDVRADHTCRWLAAGLPPERSLLLASPSQRGTRRKTRARR